MSFQLEQRLNASVTESTKTVWPALNFKEHQHLFGHENYCSN